MLVNLSMKEVLIPLWIGQSEPLEIVSEPDIHSGRSMAFKHPKDNINILRYLIVNGGRF